ncbi:MAG: hypothetical protein JSV55_02605, partial [Deltaproteobacteria bacterium]
AAGYLKRNCAEAKPAFALKRFGPVRLAIYPCSKLQGILAKANKNQDQCLALYLLLFRRISPV